MNVKKMTLSLIASLFAFSLTACFGAGVGDWTVSGLPGGYEVWRINSRQVILCMPDETHTMAKTVVPEYVFELAYNETFICAKRVDIPEDMDEKIDFSNPEYYIVAVNDGKHYGPFDEDTFYEKCQEMNMDEPIDWMDLGTLRKKLGT